MEFKDILLQYAPLSPNSIDEMSSSSELIVLQPGEELLEQGETCSFFFLVRKGIMRVSHEAESREETFLFAGDGDIYTPLHSFLNNEKSPFSFVSVVRSEVYALPYNCVRRMQNNSPEVVRWLLSLSMGQLHTFELKALMNFNKTKEERLKEYLETSDPRLGLLTGMKIARHVPLKYIASYLGVTQATLSRMRARLVRSRR